MKKITTIFIIFILLVSSLTWAQRIKDVNMLGHAKKLFDEGFYKIALMEYRQFLKDYPENENGYIVQYYLGECYFIMGDYKKAGEEFLMLIVRYPDAPNVVLGWEGWGKCF